MEFTNQGACDRALRIAVGLLLLGLGWLGFASGWPSATLKVVGFLPLVTGALGWCPLYDLVGITTKKKQELCC